MFPPLMPLLWGSHKQLSRYMGKPTPKRTFSREYRKDGNFRVLSLDGGGGKGLYTLGVLKEIEGMLPLVPSFPQTPHKLLCQ